MRRWFCRLLTWAFGREWVYVCSRLDGEFGYVWMLLPRWWRQSFKQRLLDRTITAYQHGWPILLPDGAILDISASRSRLPAPRPWPPLLPQGKPPRGGSGTAKPLPPPPLVLVPGRMMAEKTPCEERLSAEAAKLFYEEWYKLHTDPDAGMPIRLLREGAD